MVCDRDARLDLRALLDAAEAAPPTAGVEALAAELAEAVGAGEVSFLIADISGGALARLVRAQPGSAPGTERAAPATLPIAGTPAGLALRSQQVQLAVTGDEVWLWAPVTERGEAVGVLELVLPTLPDDQTVAYLASAAHALAYVVIADRRYTDLYEWGQRRRPAVTGGGDPTPAAAGVLHLRGRPVHPGRLAGAGAHRRRGHLRLRPGPRHPAPVGH